jgi:hypothetical protein
VFPGFPAFPNLRAAKIRLHELMVVVLGMVWIIGQAALITTGARRPDGAFAFRMFPESSTIDFALERDVGDKVIHVKDGAWLARDSKGVLHRFRWDDRVTEPGLYPYGQPIHASYGAAAQLDRLAHALDDVASHIDEDAETARLIASVTVRKNGGRPEHIRLTSAWRNR